MLTKVQGKNVRRWIKALESGNYKQTWGILRRVSGNNKSYCCLGVACQLICPNQPWRWGTNFITNRDIQKAYGFTSGHGFQLDNLPPITAVNDDTFDTEFPDYVNVLPFIWEWYEENKYRGRK
jgi:hypothetical protein